MSRLSIYNIVNAKCVDDALHFARKHEQRVWGSGEHEKARAEVLRLEDLRTQWLKDNPRWSVDKGGWV